MRKIIVEAEISLDGILGSTDMEFWQQLFPYHSEDLKSHLNELLFSADALLLGRKTYEGFAEVWPAREGEDADKINQMPKYVASRSLKPPLAWNASLLGADIAKHISELKRESGGPLVQYGIGELTPTMLQAGLVDEIQLLVYPFVYKQGPNAFDTIGPTKLRLLSAKPFQSGAVLLQYQPDSGS